MSITSAIVLYVMIWALTFLVAIPIRLQTQGDAGRKVPGTHDGAPEAHGLGRKAWITTGVATVIWAILAGVILSGMVTIRDIDFFNRMSPPTADGRDG